MVSFTNLTTVIISECLSRRSTVLIHSGSSSIGLLPLQMIVGLLDQLSLSNETIMTDLTILNSPHLTISIHSESYYCTVFNRHLSLSKFLHRDGSFDPTVVNPSVPSPTDLWPSRPRALGVGFPHRRPFLCPFQTFPTAYFPLDLLVKCPSIYSLDLIGEVL